MPKFETPPRFCPIHTKIHVCDEMSISNQVKTAEDEIGARARRLQGIQTEEEMMAEAAKAEANAAKTKGGIGDILAKAKARIAETKKEAANQEIDKQTKEVSQDEVNDRMAALRARMSGGGGSSAGSGDVPASKPGNTGGLGEIIEHAREISKENWQQYKVPERSHLGETPLPESKTKSNSPTEKKTSEKPKNADKMPSIALEAIDLGPDEDDFIIPKETPQRPLKQATSAKSAHDAYFTVEQTQEMIQEAVKKALTEVGLVKNKKPAAKKTATSSTKTPAKKATSSAKTPAKKTSGTTKKITTTAKPAAKKSTSKAK
jgi:hypothetical protein